MKRIGINVNSNKDPEGKILKFIIDNIYKVDKFVKIDTYKDSIGLEKEETKNLDVLIVLGGDGTILNAERTLVKYEVPILGINIGHLGFLAEIESSEFKKAIKSLFNKEYEIEERMLLESTYIKNKKIFTYNALNDTVISKSTPGRIVKCDIYVNDKFYSTFTGDGVIISTPTGSTAYSLSAGGPIIYPDLNVVSITPICPHFLGGRSLILSGDSKISIKVNKKYNDAILTMDGKEITKLNDIDEVIINKCNFKCRLIKFKKGNYFNILRKKSIFMTKECEGDKK